MVNIPLVSGAYEARSIIANAQRCVNLYPEKNPNMGTGDGDSPAPVTHYPTPGLLKLVQGDNAPVRGLYCSSAGALYTCIGTHVYYVTPQWRLVALGTILSQDTPVSFSDNGSTIVLVDGTSKGYTIAMSSNVMLPIDDPTGTFVGANNVAFLDTYLLFNNPNGQEFYCTRSGDPPTFDPLYYAQKSGGADPLMGLAVVHRSLWLFGTRTTEIWYNAGGALFPFAMIPGVFIEHGCAAKYSIATADQVVFWLGQDAQGQGVVFMGQGYQFKRISTHAIEHALGGYATLADARAFTYAEEGHYFYVLNFPTADRTWVYDLATGMWHERAWTDGNGNLRRHRAICHAWAYGAHVVGDWENGALYAMDADLYTDNGDAIQRIRSFPHILNGGKRVSYAAFMADMEVGQIRGGLLTSPPKISLRWSDTRGMSWGNPVLQSLGSTGQFHTAPTWRRLGFARDRVFELSWSVPAKTALNGAFVDVTQMGS